MGAVLGSIPSLSILFASAAHRFPKWEEIFQHRIGITLSLRTSAPGQGFSVLFLAKCFSRNILRECRRRDFTAINLLVR